MKLGFQAVQIPASPKERKNPKSVLRNSPTTKRSQTDRRQSNRQCERCIRRDLSLHPGLSWQCWGTSVLQSHPGSVPLLLTCPNPDMRDRRLFRNGEQQ